MLIVAIANVFVFSFRLFRFVFVFSPASAPPAATIVCERCVYFGSHQVGADPILVMRSLATHPHKSTNDDTRESSQPQNPRSRVKKKTGERLTSPIGPAIPGSREEATRTGGDPRGWTGFVPQCTREVCVCVFVCVCVCVCICICIYRYMYVYVCICICVYIYVHIYLYIQRHIHIYIHISKCMCVCVCVCVCMIYI